MQETPLMDRQILRAKLYVPRSRPEAVPRSGLRERLDEGTRRELTVVSAPAGFGKTTLLADWAQRSELPVAWVSLDERDDDPARFFLYLIAAIETIHEGFGKTTRAFLSSLESQEELEPVLTALSNEILESPSDFVLVLDDYHCLRSETINEALAFLLDHWPPPMHLVIAGRTSPPLPLPRLRAGAVDRARRRRFALHPRGDGGLPGAHDGPEPHRGEDRSAGKGNGRLDRRSAVGG